MAYIHMLHQLGPSALVGFALFVLVFPLQERMMSLQHHLRLRSIVWTEQRVKVLLEVLGTSLCGRSRRWLVILTACI